jgi:hypothetical protein
MLDVLAFHVDNKHLIQGVPPRLRPAIWMHASGAQAKKSKFERQYFERCVSTLLNAEDHSHVKQIDLDVARTYPEHPYFQRAEGLQSLRRVLMAYAAHNPDIGYCQSMNYVAGLLLLVLDRNPENAFWVMCALIEGVLLNCLSVVHLTSAAGCSWL